jgi:hypothetical protein
MGKIYEHIDERLAAFIAKQKMFFVGTAPLSGEGHVNLSPKGYDAFRILGPKQVAYCDLGGSGIETVAHIRENGRITIMFCAFEGPAMILRLYGRGSVQQFDDPGFEARKAELFPKMGRARNIVTVDIERIADSCGWGVPFMEFKAEREQLTRWIASVTQEEWEAKRYRTNSDSIDGLPGLKRPEAAE